MYFVWAAQGECRSHCECHDWKDKYLATGDSRSVFDADNDSAAAPGDESDGDGAGDE